MSISKRLSDQNKGSLYILICTIFFLNLSSIAQDSSLKFSAHQKVDSVLLSDTNVLTKSDYLSQLEKLLGAQNKVPEVINGFDNIYDIEDELGDDDSLIFLINARLSNADIRTVNLKSLQTFNRLLDGLQDKVKEYYQSDLLDYETRLDNLKKNLLAYRKDSIIQKIYKNTELRKTFTPQLLQIRDKWKETDSLVGEADALIKTLKEKASSNSYEITDLLSKIDDLIEKTTINAFGKERRYLWEPINKNRLVKDYASIEQRLLLEKKIADYYLQNTKSNRMLSLVIAIIFFSWVCYNYVSVKKQNKLHILQKFGFKYIAPIPVWGSLIFVASLSPLFDLAAPTIFTEAAGIISILVLSFFLIKRLPLQVLLLWGVFALLFLSHPFMRLMGMPIYQERNYMFMVNIVSVIFGISSLWILKEKVFSHKAVFGVGVFYIILNLIGIFCNLFGRVTLTQMAYTTSTYCFAQAISLTILAHLVCEAVLLQIQASRLRKKYPEDFEFTSIQNGVMKITTIGVSILWFIVFADNINLLDSLNDWKTATLNEVHSVGSFTYSIGGILLFIFIIWVANFLQKYISYFFGDLGEDMIVANKEGRSRLLMTRLIVLIGGFLLAVAASGLPIDKITIILGALSVGIGLGLQNIVNNFVSGIILIFDRTLHIGDVVQISDQKGRVKEIGIRTSKLVTDDGAEIIIPNGDVVSRNIINWTLTNSNVRLSLTFNIEKPFNLEEVEAICKKELVRNINVLPKKEIEVLITSISPNSETLKVYFWCQSITATESTYSSVYPSIYKALQARGMKLV